VSNSVAIENARPGVPRKIWDLPAGNFGGCPELQGFVDGFSVDIDEPVRFKVAQQGSRGWLMEVYRLGWYQGHGARLLSTIHPPSEQMAAARRQPAPTDLDRGSVECGAWQTIVSWKVPSGVPSGVFLARLVRTDGAASHILFVVRDDRRRPSLRVMLADVTWQAYNAFGGLGERLYAGNSLYLGTAVNQYHPDCAYVVSYDRPIVNRGACDPDRAYGAVQWSTFVTGEYPAVRWLERQGYDVAYMAGLDAAGSQAVNAPAGMIVGHNEYFSQQMKDVWVAHLKGGNHLFVCASNEAFWRVEGERLDGSRRPRRIRCHKEIIDGRPAPPYGYTGTWRARGEPENAWTGTIFAVNGPQTRALTVRPPYTRHRLWRDCGIADGWTSPPEILGFEIDTYGSAGTSSAGAGRWMAEPGPAVTYASDTTIDASAGMLLLDAGQAYGGPGTVHHRLVWVDRANGGKTFATGSVNWALGLDDANTADKVGGDNTSPVIQQATVNGLADMGVRPSTPQARLVVS
jgi:hypothetical protein